MFSCFNAIFSVYGKYLSLSFDPSSTPAPVIFHALCSELERRFYADPDTLVPKLGIIFNTQAFVDAKTSTINKLTQILTHFGNNLSNCSSLDVQKLLRDSFGVEELALLIRRYLRELPEPLIPTSLYDDFLQVGKLQIDSDALLMMEKLIENTLNIHHSM